MPVVRNDFARFRGSAIALDEDYRREALEEREPYQPTPPEELEREAQREADMIARAVACPDCLAPIGSPCLPPGTHFGRRLAFART